MPITEPVGGKSELTLLDEGKHSNEGPLGGDTGTWRITMMTMIITNGMTGKFGDLTCRCFFCILSIEKWHFNCFICICELQMQLRGHLLSSSFFR